MTEDGVVGIGSAFGNSTNNLLSTWRWNNGVLQPILWAGQQAPGYPDGTLITLPYLGGMASDGTSYIFSYNNTLGGAVYRSTLSGPPMVSIRNGDFINGVQVTSIQLVNVQSNNSVVTKIDLADGSRHITLGTPDEYLPIITNGAPAPGVAGGFLDFSTPPIRLNGANQMAIHQHLLGPGVTSLTDDAVYRYSPPGTPGGNGLELVAQKGMRLPGIPVGQALGGLYSSGSLPFVIDGAGNVTFIGEIVNNGGTGDLTTDGIWTGLPGNPDALRPVMIRGGSIPGAPALTWADGPRRFELAVNNDGTIAFDAITRNSDGTLNPRTIFLDQGGTLTQALTLGGQMPGAPAGATPVNINQWAYALNSAGGLLLHGFLNGGTFNAGMNEAMFYRTPTGDFSMLLREGGQLEVTPGVFKTILNLDSSISPSDSNPQIAAVGDGSPNIFTDSGYFVFRAEFTDGTYGLFRAQVPTPAPTTLAATALAAHALRRRRPAPRSA